MEPITALPLVLLFTVIPLVGLPWVFTALCAATGASVCSRTESRRALLFKRAQAEEEEEANKTASTSARHGEDTDWERIDSSTVLPSSKNGDKAPSEWEGVIGFFHPFCNAGGGGERVLWAAIRATQRRYPHALCVVYTGDHDVDKDTMLANVKKRFNIDLHAPRVAFLYLSARHHVLASSWPRFTLLGQSLGSLILAWDAFNLLPPDIFIDTMGYAFALAFCKLLFPSVPTAAYVHYPTISTDMLGSLSDTTGNQGVNAGLGTGWRGRLKRAYWTLFAKLYSRAGGSVDVVMTNSSWTQAHMATLWGGPRRTAGKTSPINVVFPPVAVEELAAAIPLDAAAERHRTRDILYISQFRPEKNHQLIITAFAAFIRSPAPPDRSPPPRLVLVGSVRDDTDKMLVYKLRVLARELRVDAAVEFVVNAQWAQILARLRSASVGVNGMWNEHFGIGVVEYQAAGLISVVNDSGGPRMDIVVDDAEGRPTGFHARDAEGYAAAFGRALGLGEAETAAMRERARRSARRFGEAEFAGRWVGRMEELVGLCEGKS